MVLLSGLLTFIVFSHVIEQIGQCTLIIRFCDLVKDLEDELAVIAARIT